VTEPSPGNCFNGFGSSEIPPGFDFYSGKVRDIFDLDDELLIVASDRTAAFDRILGEAPFKGEVLNRLSAYWFSITASLVENHFIASVSPRAMLVRKCRVIPVEINACGFLCDEAWTEYLATQSVAGVNLPDDLRQFERLDPPILRPSIKDSDGLHENTVDRDEVLYAGVVETDLWERMENAARTLFSRGSELAAENGLLLVKARYEFGVREDNLVLVDELHTPDSSTFWHSEGYDSAIETGEAPRPLQIAYLDQWLDAQGYRGDGHPPMVPDDVFNEISLRYQRAYEALTGAEFRTQSSGVEAEKEKLLSFIEERQEEN